MTNPLEDLIKTEIRENGPMGVGRFMSLALGHPEHGYYMGRDPFGRGGDFVTAPEISQMFGEMIGAWAADLWMRMGSPARFTLLECGPGRGTLMADMMRATKGVPGFHAAAQVCFLEISPVLKGKQEEALAGYGAQWFDALIDVPDDCPVIVVGNEFLDALPFTQMQKTADGWVERVVALDKVGALAFALGAAVDAPEVLAKVGDVFEVAPVRNAFVVDVCARLKGQGGAALFIDYGHMRAAVGDSFQAVQGHAYVDVFADVGSVDLTSHVDFEALAAGVDAHVCGPVTQGAFLKTLGIETRAAMLKSACSVEKCEGVEKRFASTH